jgi:enoyl-CoA hydratase
VTDPILLSERRGEHGEVLLLTLNRPERHNALNAALNHALGEAVAAAEPAGARVIVLTGAGGRAFCAGGDMLEMSGVEQGRDPLPPPAERRNGTEELAGTPLPVIAAVNGICYGGAALTAILCDIRIASDNASFRFPGAAYGLVVGGAQLPRIVGPAFAKELLFTARVVHAEEALRIGLVNALVPQAGVLDAAMEMARQIAQNSPPALIATKETVDRATQIDAGLASEADHNRSLRTSPEHHERFKAAAQRVAARGKQP